MPGAVPGNKFSRAAALLFCLLLPSALGFIHRGARRNITYAWRTDDWGSCFTVAEGCGEGQQERSVWCADSEGARAIEQNCDIHSRPRDKIVCLLVCDRIKPYLWWELGDWSPCNTLLHSYPEPICVEGLGVSTRNVSCIYGPPGRPPQEFPVSVCEALPEKPAIEIPCSYDCPRDCVTTEFTDYTDCAQCSGLNRTRIRRVLVAPEYEGKLCPELSEFVACNASDTCAQDATSSPGKPTKSTKISRLPEKYILKVGAWGVCKANKPSTDSTTSTGGKPHRRGFLQSPSFGIRSRKVVCLNNHGYITDIKNCLLKWESMSPPSEESCVIAVNCVVSPWSEWRVLQEGCINSLGQTRPEMRVRRRKVLRLAQGDGKSCPQLAEEKIIKENIPPCDKYHWLPLQWEDCLIPDPQPNNSSSPACGDGQQRRSVICTKTKELVPVPESLCFEPRPLETQRCHVPCLRTCLTTDWTAWGPCTPSEGNHHFQLPAHGFRLRDRKIVDEGSEPESCPHLFEKEKCDDPERFRWSFGAWGQCKPYGNSTCGKGDKNRKATCTLLAGEATSSAYCRIHLGLPEENEECYVPCPDDCILSEWSQWTCSQPCFNDKEGLMKMFRVVLAPAGPGGRACELELKDEDVCNTWSCHGNEWKTEKWSQCQPLPVPTPYTSSVGPIAKPTCGAGEQTRKVWCDHKGRSVDKERCYDREKLKDTRNCVVPCPVDCKVTEFSDWTACPDKCSPNMNQNRQRYVVQKPQHGGMLCPQIMQEWRSCYEDNNPSCYRPNNTYTWAMEKWSHCQPLAKNGKKCGPGQQIRDVVCQANGDSQAVEPWYCLEQTKVNGAGPPLQVRPCEVLCDLKCSLTGWISNHSCENSCSSTIPQERIVIGADKNEKECEQINEGRIRRCPPIEEFSDQGPWQDCLLEEDKDCGTGIRYRVAPGKDITTCQQIGIQKESCEVECPVDCEMTLWTKWTPCTTRCGQGYRERSRKVTQVPNYLGRPCPPGLNNNTDEAVEVCESSCDKFTWLVDGWSACAVQTFDQPEICGNGTQTRGYRCVLTQVGHPSIKTEDEKCDHAEKPMTHRECRITCPGDCLVSEWGPWSACGAPCNDSQDRSRTRNVIRSPSGDGKSCPPLVQKQRCKLGVNCFKFSWILGPWGSCSLVEGARCGEGQRSRALMCQSSKDGAGVNPKLCEGLSPVLKEHLIQNCSVQCPVDCRVSSWSGWDQDACKPCMKQGLQVRRRRMLQAPSTTGRPCPSLFQNKPCPFLSCYHWEIGNLSQCQIQTPGLCGFGIQRRSVVCRRSDGAEVDEISCLRVNASMVTRLSWVDNTWLRTAQDVKDWVSCHIPCPGDCRMTEWSDWSHCDRDCAHSEEVGYQTRSRSVLSPAGGPDAEPCPMDLYETKPCWGGPCLTFEWKMFGNERKCVRTDGLIVSEAGCARGGRRQQQAPCPRFCPVRESVCDPATGQCLCRMGATARHDPLTGHLTDCQPMDTDSIHSHNHTGHGPDIIFKYFPDDNETSFWMYAMISVGTAFVIFVAVTIYLMCHSSLRERLVDVRRQGNMRRRPPLPTIDLNVNNGAPKVT